MNYAKMTVRERLTQRGMISFGGYGWHSIGSIPKIKAHTLPVSVRQSPVVFISVSGLAIYSISSKIEKKTIFRYL